MRPAVDRFGVDSVEKRRALISVPAASSAFALWLFVTHADAAEPVPRTYVCQRTSGDIEIDGRMREPVWDDAPWTEAFMDIRGSEAPAPRFLTRAKMLWGDRNLYIAARLEDPNVRARLTERDAIVFHDNDFEVFLDPEGDGRNYFEIEINARNTIFDLLLENSYRNGGPARHEWDVRGLRAAVHVEGTLNQPDDDDRGWTVELAIPWSGLSADGASGEPPRPGDRWRMNFSRVQWPDDLPGGGPDRVGKGIEDNWVWSPMGEVDMHIPGRWGIVAFAAPGADPNGAARPAPGGSRP